MTGLFGLIISQLLLFLILTRILSRLKDVAIALPLLASGQFESFRQSLSVSELIRNSRDEVDTLSEAAITLSHQLEKLELKISSRTKMLIEQRDEQKNMMTLVWRHTFCILWSSCPLLRALWVHPKCAQACGLMLFERVLTRERASTSPERSPERP